MSDRRRGAICRSLMLPMLWMSASCIASRSDGFDVPISERGIGEAAATSDVARFGGCALSEPDMPLRFAEAVARAMCRHPETRAAWADVKTQAAALGVARAAYLPTLSLAGQAVRQGAVTDVTGHPALSSATRANVYSANASINWLLYDFGARSADVRHASALLEATRWTRNATLLSLYVAVAKDYYAAQAAEGVLAAASETERNAGDVARIARARVNKGIAPLSDVLQADTSYQQAAIAKSKANGEWLTARGALAVDLDLRPDFALSLPQVVGHALPEVHLSRSIRDLLGEVERMHPGVLAAEAQVGAANAKAERIRASGLPTLGLTGRYGRNNQPASQGLGIPQYAAAGREWYVGFQVSIPLFEGFSRRHQVRQALAERDKQVASLDSARQRAVLEAWSSYQALKVAFETVAQSEALLRTAMKSSEVAEKRYRLGVGNMLEVLSAQRTLADSRQRRVEAISEWSRQRVRFGAALGRVGDEDIDLEVDDGKS
ncbi:TolC family protein [Burkholderia gladioli]|uniref:TolC family protein n=1 Tax=Burkholderia gladioli TaxID=28095 RepID=UPI00163F0BFB|nr:TolC family protein [Burkholderia gladioli]